MKDILTVTDLALADIRFQDGALPHAMGVKSFQVMRANRAHPEWSDGFGWTYNHAPMIAHYHGCLYVEYLSNPVSEHETPGQTLICRSENGMDWSFPQVIFPTITVSTHPYKGPKSELLTDEIQTVPHQRMGFYVSKNDVFLALSFYGIVHDRSISAPCDGWGVGRAVRRIFPDGSFGDIHFLIYNEPAGYTRENTDVFSCYKESGDPELIQACDELLSDGAMIRQMYEEQKFDKALFPTPGAQALSFYTAKDGKMIGVYKQGLTSVSTDQGKTWSTLTENPTVRTASGKVWGQRTGDGRYALAYNPSPDGQHRWPIAIVTGEDGYTFSNMLSVTGWMSPQRYGGIDKNLGPQYLRGICERNPQPSGGSFFLTYSNNKEDIWASEIPVPVLQGEENDIRECFDGESDLPRRWSIYSPAWAPVRMEEGSIVLRDTDPYDRAQAERSIKKAGKGEIELRLSADSVAPGASIVIELQDDAGRTPVKAVFDAEGRFLAREGGRTEPRAEYVQGKQYSIRFCYDCLKAKCEITFGEWKKTLSFSENVHAIARVSIATKDLKQIPYSDTESNGKYGTREQVLANAGERTRETKARIFSFSARSLA